MTAMELALAVLAIALLGFLLHRDDCRNRDAEPYWRRGTDRDAERVRADLLAGADALSRRPLSRARSTSSDWEPRA